MNCVARSLAIVLATALSATALAETREMRVFHIATGLDLGEGSGPPDSDYFLDGGRADGLEVDMRLPVYRELRLDDRLRDRGYRIRMLVGELAVLRVFEDTALARVSAIEPAPEAPVFEPRAVLIGDVVPHAPSGIGHGGGVSVSTDATSGDGALTAAGDEGPGVDARGADAAPLSFAAAPEAFPPGFPSANKWYPLPPPVLFALNSYELDPAAQQGLEGVAMVLVDNPERLIALEGRTCDLGSPRYNQKLSLRRARNVAAFLQSRGVAAERVSVDAFGEDSPVAPNTSESTRRQNRRVDLRVGTVGPTLEPEIPGITPYTKTGTDLFFEK